MKKDFIEVTPDQGSLNNELVVTADTNLSFSANSSAVTISGGGVSKTVAISQLPNFPPVFGRYMSGSVVTSGFINQTRFDIENEIPIMEFQNPGRTYTYSMGFSAINDEIITKSISSHLSIRFDGTLTAGISKAPIKDSNFVVIGHIFPLEGVSHTVEYLWDGILFFKYIVTYTA